MRDGTAKQKKQSLKRLDLVIKKAEDDSAFHFLYTAPEALAREGISGHEAGHSIRVTKYFKQNKIGRCYS